MATASTASSGTEGLDPEPPEEPAAGPTPGTPAEPSPETEPEHDPARRAFFREFGKQAVSAAGQVAGVASLMGASPGGSIAGLLGLDEPGPTGERATFARSGRGPVSVAPPAADDAFRSPYRLAGAELVMLDQRGLPERLDEVVAKRGSDVAYYLRLGVVRGGPAMAQVAAYGLALTAAERTEQPGQQRDTELRRTERSLVETQPSSRLPGWALARMRAAIAGLGEASPGGEVAATLRREADAIAADFATWHAAIADALSELLGASGSGPLRVLIHGGQGALSGGTVGTGLTALRRLRDGGGELRVFVTEGRPFMDGARLTSWELRQAGIEHKIVPDAAVAWLLERESIEAVLLAAEWVAINGDIGALVGSRAIAELAAARGVPVIASGVSATIDEATPDGAAIPVQLRPASEMVAYLAGTPVRTADALVPAADVMPAGTVSALVTERGSVAPGGRG